MKYVPVATAAAIPIPLLLSYNAFLILSILVGIEDAHLLNLYYHAVIEKMVRRAYIILKQP